MNRSEVTKTKSSKGLGPLPSSTVSKARSPADRLPFERQLVFGMGLEPSAATPRERFEAVAKAVRDRIVAQWVRTERAYRGQDAKRVYYLSMEFLIGRSLANNVLNMGMESLVEQACQSKGLDWLSVVEQEPDAGLGNGGLGRLAACLLDSMATLRIPAMGYGLRYDYGIFKQGFSKGWQSEQPDRWLDRPDPWEFARPEEAVEVKLNCSFEVRKGQLRIVRNRPSSVMGIPYDRPIVGFGGRSVNTLRLWKAEARDTFDFHRFCRGDFVDAMSGALAMGTLTRVLYPDDSTTLGRVLRFLQEYFLAACSMQDLVRRFRKDHEDWSTLADHAAIQINDTHPAMAVPELLRIMLDEAHLGWDQAWDITRRIVAYTNHTLLPEALERWPIRYFKAILPRHLELIREIDRRFLQDVRLAFPGDERRERRMAVIDSRGSGRVRMAHLAIVGSHSTNGVSKIHTDLLRRHVVSDLAELFPERFSNKTNGVSPRRWLYLANPWLSEVITKAIGSAWPRDLDQLDRLRAMAHDPALGEAFRRAKVGAKLGLVDWLRATTGLTADPDTIFDSQIKRVHEYKRQLLNALHIVILYQRLRQDPNLAVPPRTFFFAGKAAPSYHVAKVIIKLINNLATVIDADTTVNRKIRVLYVPDYSVTVAEHLIPATDVSEQISTAGYEASGTGNMKFMLNGALTVGTRDGATIEMAEAVGEDNMFLFGLTAEQVQSTRAWYDPNWHYENEPQTRAAIDLILGGHFDLGERGVFEPLRRMLFVHKDYYMHLADLMSYAQAHQRVVDLYGHPEEWTAKAILNVAASSRFSSDRTVRDYAREIWQAKPVKIKSRR